MILLCFKKYRYLTSSFNRPGFQAMLKAIENKEINCIIVKDLSRFGREHIDVDRYIQKVFPQSLESNIEKQEEYMEDLLENKLLCEEWVNTFLEKPSLGDLDRDMLLQYVEKINVFEGRKIEIVYRFQDELVTAARLAEQIGKTKQEVAV